MDDSVERLQLLLDVSKSSLTGDRVTRETSLLRSAERNKSVSKLRMLMGDPAFAESIETTDQLTALRDWKRSSLLPMEDSFGMLGVESHASMLNEEEFDPNQTGDEYDSMPTGSLALKLPDSRGAGYGGVRADEHYSNNLSLGHHNLSSNTLEMSPTREVFSRELDDADANLLRSPASLNGQRGDDGDAREVDGHFEELLRSAEKQNTSSTLVARQRLGRRSSHAHSKWDTPSRLILADDAPFQSVHDVSATLTPDSKKPKTAREHVIDNRFPTPSITQPSRLLDKLNEKRMHRESPARKLRAALLRIPTELFPNEATETRYVSPYRFSPRKDRTARDNLSHRHIDVEPLEKSLSRATSPFAPRSNPSPAGAATRPRSQALGGPSCLNSPSGSLQRPESPALSISAASIQSVHSEFSTKSSLRRAIHSPTAYRHHRALTNVNASLTSGTSSVASRVPGSKLRDQVSRLRLPANKLPSSPLQNSIRRL